MSAEPAPAGHSAHKAQKLSAYRSASWEEMAAFIGPNAERFRPAWEKLRDRAAAGDGRPGLAVSWPALIFTFAWFFYRKMWLLGLAVLVLPTLLGMLLDNMPASMAAMIAVAMFGKGLYLQHAARRIAATKAGGGGIAEIGKAGGVSVTGAVIGGAMLLLSTAGMIAALFYMPVA